LQRSDVIPYTAGEGVAESEVFNYGTQNKHQRAPKVTVESELPRSILGLKLSLKITQNLTYFLQIAVARAANSQPTFDFLTGAEAVSRPPSRDTFRQSGRVSSAETHRDRPLIEPEEEVEKICKQMDELKAEVKTLKYTIDNHKQEEELAKLRHESELRESRRKGEEDFKKMQAAEAERSKAVRQYEALLKEMTDERNNASNEKAALEKKFREAEEKARLLEEEIEDSRTEREDGLRIIERRSNELESRNETLQRTVEELQQDSDQREALLSEVQQQLADKDTAYGALEAEVLRLKAQTGDADTLGIIKRELSEQVSHIKKLESSNRKQATELDHFKKLHKSVEVVEEEKRSLQRKVDAMESLQNELGEAQIQRKRLEDERLAWTAYIQSQNGVDGDSEFDSPEALARAFIEERLRTATYLERNGSLESDLLDKDNIIQTLESQKSSLAEQLEKLKSSVGSTGSGNTGAAVDTKARLRLERQRALAIKEVEYLRAQIKTFDAEDTTFHAENIDEAKKKRIQELEDMVDQYRQEVQSLHSELAAQELSTLPPTEPSTLKRTRYISEDNEQLGVLSRKNRKLQDELSALQTTTKVLQTELSVSKERLTAASEQSKTRILSLRSNPTSDFEAIKMSTLNALRKENADLLAQVQNGKRGSTVQSVPMSALEAAQRDVRDAQIELASEKKRNDRLLKVWRSKSGEFRELVISLLGWDVVFMKSGKTNVTSFYYPSKEDEENSIEFDGERGTMKVSGGPQSKFAGRISEQVKFWVHERGSIPCFLAALTLEFYEEANRDATSRVDV
jgi:mitotic spindle assembly checkpoint protein MAD1